jgi:ABC-type xylose transport system permease subunit
MSQATDKSVIEHPPVVADVEPQKSIGGIKISTTNLRTYTMVFALIVIWVFFHYVSSPNCPSFVWPWKGFYLFFESLKNHFVYFFSFDWIREGIFLSSRNFSNLVRQTAVTGVIAVGMLMVIVTGQIDLSVGSVVGLAGGISAVVLTWLGWGFIPSILAAVVVGLIIGVLQGTLVAYANIPAFIVTLGGLLVWRGIIKGVTQGNTIPIGLREYKDIGQSYVPPVIGFAIAALAIGAIIWLAFRRTRARARYGLGAPSIVSTAMRIVIPSLVILGFILRSTLMRACPSLSSFSWLSRSSAYCLLKTQLSVVTFTPSAATRTRPDFPASVCADTSCWSSASWACWRGLLA